MPACLITCVMHTPGRLGAEHGSDYSCCAASPRRRHATPPSHRAPWHVHSPPPPRRPFGTRSSWRGRCVGRRETGHIGVSVRAHVRGGVPSCQAWPRRGLPQRVRAPRSGARMWAARMWGQQHSTPFTAVQITYNFVAVLCISAQSLLAKHPCNDCATAPHRDAQQARSTDRTCLWTILDMPSNL